ncbi:hypothetical protein FHU41_000286 [Psychromicrobium silvestre]|uniref:DUF402 domain-containing protein n=1 Tax=Psychromicrobium silvestre TaxID=1645614 RepID=A0A7Y9LR52_9MICC|nr:DUF402 domain-containing protein [Psychromicrobium silvestre]NYE94065.1 hypothetical protein [Psychromicrobium silvestre]
MSESETTPAVGDLVVARHRKWDGGAHWVVPGTYLGSDEVGHWVHQPAGSFVSKPGSGFMAVSPAVLLVPFEGEWVATFYDDQHPEQCSLYVDIVTEISWNLLTRDEGWEMTLIDMDLDVITARDRTWVDDEDEFAEHQVRYGYPAEVISRMEAECSAVHRRVLAEVAPFDGRADSWLRRGALAR